MHGFSFDNRMWCRQLDYFGDRCHALAYDARGYGRSALPDTSSPSPSDDVHAILTQQHINRAILIAHSMAAIPACEYCLAHPDRVAAMVLVSPVAPGYRWPDAFMAQWGAYQELASVSLEAARRAWLGADLFRVASADPTVAGQMRAMVDSYSGWHWLAQQPTQRSDLSLENLEGLEQPVLLVSGTDDDPAFLGCASSLAAHLPNAHQELINGADHMCNMEQPETFNSVVCAFVRETVGEW